MKTGVDKILQQMGGSPEKNKTGVDKILEILENGGGGGGGLPEVTSADNGDVLAVVDGAWAKADPPSGLPSYTSADKGKVLALGEGSSSTTEVIVPEQSVTMASYTQGDEGVVAAIFSSSPFDPDEGFPEDDYVLKLNGVDYPLVSNEWSDLDFGSGVYLYLNYDDVQTGLFLVVEGTTVGQTYTVSLTRSVPSVEPKWEQVIPALPTTDGDYKLTISDGVASWTAAV